MYLLLLSWIIIIIGIAIIIVIVRYLKALLARTRFTHHGADNDVFVIVVIILDDRRFAC